MSRKSSAKPQPSPPVDEASWVVNLASLSPDLLDTPQYTRADASAVTGLSGVQIDNALNRGLIALVHDHNPGTGRRRLFTGRDLLALATAHTLGRFLPLRVAGTLAEQVYSRALALLMGAASPDERYTIVISPLPDDDWLFAVVRLGVEDSTAAEHDLPPAVLLFDVDTLVTSTLTDLQRIVVGGRPRKKRRPKVPETESLRDFMRAWDVDAEGNKVLVGLTVEETREHDHYLEAGRSLRGDDLARARERYIELYEKHEQARLRRVGEEIAARMQREAAGQ